MVNPAVLKNACYALIPYQKTCGSPEIKKNLGDQPVRFVKREFCRSNNSPGCQIVVKDRAKIVVKEESRSCKEGRNWP
ncbi:hypothetical protein O3M35_001647 [Rhynocoris fuscipes]|uniref:Uncharacterized protein n=1 Tax=Rhynocoris fuscipes TaxID=488301 RepID=A0AAW1CN79_9HEMI